MRSSHASHPWYQWTRQPRLRDPPHPPPPSSTTPRPAPDLSRDRPDDGRRSVDDPVVVAGCDADDAECANPPEETYSEFRLYSAVHSCLVLSPNFMVTSLT